MTYKPILPRHDFQTNIWIEKVGDCRSALKGAERSEC